MMFLAPIVFVGIVGSHHESVEHQLGPTLEKVGISEMAVPDSERAAIVKHTKASKQLVKSLHVGGVIAGQLTGSGAARTFRVVIYDAEGNLTSDLESPISASGLTKSNLEVFEANVADIAATATPPAKPQPPQRMAKRQAAPVDATPPRSAGADDDAPPGFGGSPKTEKHAAAPAVAVAVADDDAAAAAAPAVVESAPPSRGGEHGIHVHVGLLAGFVGRNLATDPNTVKTYTSSPVGTGGFEGALGIGARIRIVGSFEHTLVMHSDVAGTSATSQIGRAEGTIAYDVVHGGVQLAPVVGAGTRYFSIDSTSGDRTPDTEYVYVVLGATVAKQLGSRWALRGTAAFEPVVGGLHAAMLPDPARWGFDVGAALEVRATTHVFARAAFDYQSFASTWSMTGSATDAYPSGTVVAGAAF